MRPIVRGSAVLAASLMLAACGGGGGATTSPTSAGATTAPPASAPGTADACAPVEGGGGTVTASIEGNTFIPATINAKVGDVITWTNGDSVPHGIELDDGPQCTDTIAGGGTGSGSFSQAGTFPFHCSVHASMKGSFTIAPA